MRNALDGKCVLGVRSAGAAERPAEPMLYSENGDQCILGQAEKHATRLGGGK